MSEPMPWRESQPGRIPPRECIAAARDDLNSAFSADLSDGRLALHWIRSAVDWQRRALEQMLEGRPA